MSTKFTYALIMTVCQVVFSLVMYFLGFETEKLAVGQYFGWLALVYTIVVLWLGIKAVREESPGQALGYGGCVGAGTLICLYSGLMGGVYRFIHLKFINTSFADYQIEFMRTKWVAKGMSDAQMDQAEGFTRGMMGPVAQGIMTPVFAVIFGVLVALVLAIFLKRTPPAEAA
jgi:hypothetical protein